MLKAFKNESFWKILSKKTFSLFAAYLAKCIFRLLLMTCRIHIEGIDCFIALAKKERCILMLWHNRLAPLAYILNKFAPQYDYAAFISNSRDGDSLAILADSYRQGRAIRVPHDARHTALCEMIKQMKRGTEIFIITPDGPRGPQYQVKPGIILAAKITQAQIIPLTWSADRFWQFKTWDKLMFPKPFAKLFISLGDPIKFAQDSEQSLEDKINFLQNSLNHLNRDTFTKVAFDKIV